MVASSKSEILECPLRERSASSSDNKNGNPPNHSLHQLPLLHKLVEDEGRGEEAFASNNFHCIGSLAQLFVPFVSLV